MKDFILFLLFTVGIILGTTYYTDYCVSQPCPLWISIPVGIIVFVGLVFYFRYLVKQFVKLLKL